MVFLNSISNSDSTFHIASTSQHLKLQPNNHLEKLSQSSGKHYVQSTIGLSGWNVKKKYTKPKGALWFCRAKTKATQQPHSLEERKSFKQTQDWLCPRGASFPKHVLQSVTYLCFSSFQLEGLKNNKEGRVVSVQSVHSAVKLVAFCGVRKATVNNFLPLMRHLFCVIQRERKRLGGIKIKKLQSEVFTPLNETSWSTFWSSFSISAAEVCLHQTYWLHNTSPLCLKRTSPSKSSANNLILNVNKAKETTVTKK